MRSFDASATGSPDGAGTGPLLSVVVPTYKSAKFIGETIEQTCAALDAAGLSFEMVIVDDCSPDDTWAVLGELKAALTPRVKMIRLMRNAGQHNAILAGFDYAAGSIVATMDDDLQHSPGDIPKLVAAVQAGDDLAIAAYENAKQHTAFRNLGGRMVDALIRRIFSLPPDFQLTSFRAIDRRVVDRVLEMQSGFTYVTCMLLSYAGKVSNVGVVHHERVDGRSGYTFWRSARLALNLLFGYSQTPIFLGAFFCALSLAISAIAMLWVLKGVVSGGAAAVPGWASTIGIVTFMNALTLMSLLIIGVYVVRIHGQLADRGKRFLVGEKRL